ncbi:MAG: glycosyltransferase family 39 protein [Aggregatilineales bacterium]
MIEQHPSPSTSSSSDSAVKAGSPAKTGRPAIGHLSRIAAILLALTALIFLYFWTHKPQSLAFYLILGGALVDMMTVGALTLVAGAIGRASASALAARTRVNILLLSRAERLALDAALGLGIISSAALLVGLAGGFRAIVFWPLLGLAAFLLRRALRSWLGDCAGLAGALWLDIRSQPPWLRALAAMSAVLLALALVHALAPPYAWDSMTYHLVQPKLDLAAGRVLPAPDNFYIGFPKLTEILFGVTMSLFGRETAAAPVHFVYGALGLLAIGGLARRISGRETGWVAAFLLLGSYEIWLLMGRPYVEMTVLTYGVLAVGIAILWRERDQAGWLVFMGLLCGFALGAKYTSGLLIAGLGLYLFAYRPHAVLRNGVIFGLSAAIAFAPWMLRGLLHYDNPVYPYFFGGLNWDGERAEMFNQVGRGLLSRGEAWLLIALPITATIFGLSESDVFTFVPGPWLLTLPLLLPLVWRWLTERERPFALGGALLLVPIYGFWIIAAAFTGIGMQTRLMIALVPLSALLGALVIAAIARWPQKPVNLHFILRVLIVITFAVNLVDVVYRITSRGVIDVMTAVASREEYLFLQLMTMPDTLEQLAALPKGTRVRLMWEPRYYHCPAHIDCDPDELFDHWSRAVRDAGSPEAAFAAFRAAGDDYLLFFRFGYERFPTFRPEIDALFPAAVEAALTPVWTTPDGRYTLYVFDP